MLRTRASWRRSISDVDAVVHAAAESHVDRSIDEPSAFLRTNVLGTQVTLDACRERGTRMLMLSTDEVYGPGAPGAGAFDETAPLRPASPYAASKAAADLLCSAYVTTYRTPVAIVRGTNTFGPRQIERVVPTFAIAALEGRSVPVYGDGTQRREFLFVSDWVDAALTVLDAGATGEVYNIGGGFSSRTWISHVGSACWPVRPSPRSRSWPIDRGTTSGMDSTMTGSGRWAGRLGWRSTTGSRARWRGTASI